MPFNLLITLLTWLGDLSPYMKVKPVYTHYFDANLVYSIT